MLYLIGISALGGLARLRDCKSKGVSSYDRTGGNKDYVIIEPGERKVIAEIDGAGAIKHIWFGGEMKEEYWLRKILLRMYWDGELEPSVEVPMGDFLA
ncbi:MAG: DUF2961 domain-containing protein [Candidatus Bathyarchaeia archaeon]